MMVSLSPFLGALLAVLVAQGSSKPDSDFRWGYSKGQIQAAMSTMRSHYGSNYQDQISTLCQSLLQSNGTQGSTGANPGSDQSDESSKGNDDLADLLDTRSAEGDGLERRARKQAATRHANARNKGKPHLKGSKAAKTKGATAAHDAALATAKTSKAKNSGGVAAKASTFVALDDGSATTTPGTTSGSNNTTSLGADGDAPGNGTPGPDSNTPASTTTPDSGTTTPGTGDTTPASDTPGTTTPGPGDSGANAGTGTPGSGSGAEVTPPPFVLPPFLRHMDQGIIQQVCRIMVDSSQPGSWTPKTGDDDEDDDDKPGRPWDRWHGLKHGPGPDGNATTNGTGWGHDRKPWTMPTATVTVTVTQTATVTVTVDAAPTV
ncbi:hypothetical protein PANT_25d00052 [Moesziomyces antarcticus T-34]|uniref:Uncharacterized protein n=1 Tax=Pseudozyma antarctica (strain T-34) TaxID=1151754 RepID=M9LSX9_PSEA3|nr:hypothetical protein PANT_25d00052 [Moesziomyces antarcticus T-34]